MPKKFLYIQPEENIAYVIDKISGASEGDLYLVVDANPSILTDPINLKLFKKEIGELSKRIIIASKAPEILEVAGKAGFETTSEDISLEEGAENDEIPIDVRAGNAEKSTTQQRSAMQQEFEIPDVAEDDSKTDLPLWMRKKSTEESDNSEMSDINENRMRKTAVDFTGQPIRKFLSWKFIGISILVIIGLAIGGFYFLSPKVTLNITLRKAPLNLDFKVVSDATVSAVDVKNAKIPGQFIKLEKELSDQFVATGKQDTESKAEGEITIYNEFGPNSQKLVKNTRFKSKNGSIFRLKGDVIVPGATVKDGKVVAPGIIISDVIADQPGSSYNIAASDFTIPGFEGTPKFIVFYGKSSSSMSGGSSVGGSKFVTKEDLSGAQTALIEKFKKLEEELIGNNLTQGLKTLPHAKEDPVFEFSVEPVGSDGKFIGKLKVSEKIFAFSENDIHSLVDQYLSGKLSGTQTLDPESKSISYTDEALGANNLSLSFTVKINQSVKGKIDEMAIKKDLSGKSEAGMKEVLKSNDAIESAEFAFWPIWISVAPKNPDKIGISIHE